MGNTSRVLVGLATLALAGSFDLTSHVVGAAEVDGSPSLRRTSRLGETRESQANRRAIDGHAMSAAGWSLTFSHSDEGPREESSTDPAPPNESVNDVDPLQARIEEVLRVYASPARRLNTRDHSPWEVMHAIIGYGVATEIVDVQNDRAVNAIGWLGWSGRCRGESLVVLERDQIAARQGPRVQGHYGQFLAILAQSKVRDDYPLRVGEQEFTVADLIDMEMVTCRRGEELTFKLIGLMHYLKSDATWTSRSGETWTIERLIREERNNPIRGAACGGTHRLMGLSYAVGKRLQRDEPLDGEFAEALSFTNQYQDYAFSLQNDDGSFSTEWFRGPGARNDLNRRLQTSGHILEWLAYSLPEEQLSDPRMTAAAEYVAGILLAGQNRRWEIGPLGHALHALSLYEARRYGPREADGNAGR